MKNDIEGFVQDQSAGRFAHPVGGRRRRQQQRSHQVSERRVRRLRAVVGRRRRRRRRRQAGHAAPTRPGHRQDPVRLGERHIDDEAERQAAPEEVPVTARHARARANAVQRRAVSPRNVTRAQVFETSRKSLLSLGRNKISTLYTPEYIVYNTLPPAARRKSEFSFYFQKQKRDSNFFYFFY